MKQMPLPDQPPNQVEVVPMGDGWMVTARWFTVIERTFIMPDGYDPLEDQGQAAILEALAMVNAEHREGDE